MADLDLSTLKAYTPLFPMLIKKYEQFVPDQNASVLDKINSIIAELNAIGQLSNNVVKDWNTVYQWCMNDGLQTDVNNKLEDMRTNGEISDILNNIFDNLAGDMTTLHTTAKDKLVNSINEVDDLAKLNQTNIGDLTTLTTTDKENLVAAINNNVASLAEIAHQFVDVSTFIQTGDTTINNAFNLAVSYAQAKGFKNLYIPAGTYYVNPTGASPYTNVGLLIPSNFNLYMSNDCILQATTNSSDNYRMINLQNVQNVHIYGGTIQGDRTTHTGTTGEWGHGIYAIGSKNIHLHGITVTNCWGDGICLDNGCEKVFLYSLESSNNRRNNLTIISCKIFRANNCTFNNANGTSPEAGIDIEPNDVNADLYDIKIVDCIFDGSHDRGFSINTMQMAESNKEIDIEFIRPIVRNTNIGISIRPANNTTGSIRITEPRILNCTGRGIWFINPICTGAKITVTRPRILNVQTQQTTNDGRLDAAIVGFLNFSYDQTQKLGNIEITEPNIDAPKAVGCISLYDYRSTVLGLKNVSIINPVKMQAAYDSSFDASANRYMKYYFNDLRENFLFVDNSDKQKLDLSTLNNNAYIGISTNWKANNYIANSATQVTTGLCLPNTVNDEEITFTYENLGAGGMRIYFRDLTNTLVQKQLYNANNNALTYTMITSSIRAFVKLKIVNGGVVVVEQRGTWSYT